MRRKNTKKNLGIKPNIVSEVSELDENDSQQNEELPELPNDQDDVKTILTKNPTTTDYKLAKLSDDINDLSEDLKKVMYDEQRIRLITNNICHLLQGMLELIKEIITTQTS